MAGLLLLLTGRGALTQLSGAGPAGVGATFPAGAAPITTDGTVTSRASTAPQAIDLTLDRLRGEGIHGNRSV